MNCETISLPVALNELEEQSELVTISVVINDIQEC